jgi:DNA-binding response OmpR family regulator
MLTLLITIYDIGPATCVILTKERKPKIPIVGLTGNALGDINYFRECGVMDVLIKPLDIKKLNAIIQDINEKKAAGQFGLSAST